MNVDYLNKIRRGVIFLWILALGIVVLIIQLAGDGVFNKLIRHISPGTACKDCNVILITIDSCAARNIGCYGYSRDTMPNLCSLAEKNILFQKTYANSYWTLPSHASLFTGLYPSHHGIYEPFKDTLVSSVLLLNEVLNDAGYDFLTFMPKNTSFLPESIYLRDPEITASDSSDIKAALSTFTAHVNNGHKTFMSFYSQPVCHEPYLFERSGRMYTNDSIPIISDTAHEFLLEFSEVYLDYLLERLPQMIQERDLNDKTYILESLHSALERSVNIQQAERVYRDVVFQSAEADRFLKDIYNQFRYFQSINPDDRRQMNYMRALYDEKLHDLDATLMPPIIQALTSEELKDNTVLVITSEHGQEHGEHGVMGHQTLYDQNLQVPFVMRIPGYSSKRVVQPVQLVDIMPTIIDVVGITTTQTLDGISLVPMITWPYKDYNRFLVASNQEDVVIRDREWKLFIQKNSTNDGYSPYLMFNTDQDPLELNDILPTHLQKANLMIDHYEKDL